MIHVLYRLLAGENKRERPEWYSKHNCFSSLLANIGQGIDLRIFLNGGECDWLPDFVHTTRVNIPVISESFLLVYHEALLFPRWDWVYFCEDDYLHVPGALFKLQNCIEDVKPDLVSLYDHPDRYRDLPEHNYTQGKNDIFISRNHHWRTIPSTCMTFGASVKVLRENQDLFEKWTYVDFELFPRLLGFKEDRPNKYLMVGAIPSLATHCQTDYLAPCVEWSP